MSHRVFERILHPRVVSRVCLAEYRKITDSSDTFCVYTMGHARRLCVCAVCICMYVRGVCTRWTDLSIRQPKETVRVHLCACAGALDVCCFKSTDGHDLCLTIVIGGVFGQYQTCTVDVSVVVIFGCPLAYIHRVCFNDWRTSMHI